MRVDKMRGYEMGGVRREEIRCDERGGDDDRAAK
jgi:hypothetical protein